jgi:hypothetical protein
MKKRELYIKPEVEIVALKERLMLELPVSDSFVDDEAAKESHFEDTEEDVFGSKSKNLWDE